MSDCLFCDRKGSIGICKCRVRGRIEAVEQERRRIERQYPLTSWWSAEQVREFKEDVRAAGEEKKPLMGGGYLKKAPKEGPMGFPPCKGKEATQ